MTEEEIKDRSKGDMFVKVIAVGQIVWSVIQIIVRATRRLAVSPLEIAVVAFAVCAVLICGLYWNKPQRVNATKTIQLREGIHREGECMPQHVLTALRSAQRIERGLGDLPGAPISVDSGRFVGRISSSGCFDNRCGTVWWHSCHCLELCFPVDN